MGFSIGRKINLLVVTLLLLAISGVVISATDFFSSDLTRFLRKGTLDSAAMLAGRVRAEFKPIITRAKILATSSLEDFKHDADRTRFMEQSISEDPFFIALALYRKSTPPGPAQKAAFQVVWRAVRTFSSDQPKPAAGDFTELDRRAPLNFDSAATGRIEMTRGNLLPKMASLRLALPFVKEADGSFSQMLVLDLYQDKLNSLFEESLDFAGFLINPAGEVLASTQLGKESGLSAEGLSQIRGFLQDARRPASQFDITDARGEPKIAAIERVGFADLAVLTEVPKAWTTRVRNELFIRSAELAGVFLFLALLISYYLTGAISGPIQALSFAANRISAGDFSVRIKGVKSRDEVSTLARSFNAMAERISDLMTETAEKVRMEGELQTAKIIQNRFYPERDYESPRFTLMGRSVPATECAGDWWHYVEVENHVVIVVGDVTGHGVSAALVTGAAHTAFSLYLVRGMELLRNGEEGKARFIQELVEQINLAIYCAAGGTSSMSLIVSVVNLENFHVVSANLAHPVPYVFRKAANADGNFMKNLKPLALPNGSLLGNDPAIQFETSDFQLMPDDLLLWYTDGLIEARNPEGSAITKKRVLKTVDELSRKHGDRIADIYANLMDEVQGFIGAEARPDDDVTVALGKFRT